MPHRNLCSSSNDGDAPARRACLGSRELPRNLCSFDDEDQVECTYDPCMHQAQSETTEATKATEATLTQPANEVDALVPGVPAGPNFVPPQFVEAPGLETSRQSLSVPFMGAMEKPRRLPPGWMRMLCHCRQRAALPSVQGGTQSPTIFDFYKNPRN